MSDENLPKNEANSDSDIEEINRQPVGSLGLDLGDDCVHNVESNRLGTQASSVQPVLPEETASNNPKREDNPFSFKHFLRDNASSGRNYQLLGARPKVYRDSKNRHVTPPESPQRPNDRKLRDFPSALPDFVQDHFVLLECFGAQTDQRTPNGPNVSRSNSLEEPAGVVPLDLPPSWDFRLDLPLSSGDHQNTPLGEVGPSKSLPDFLTDGPVRTGIEGATPTCPTLSDPNGCRRCIELTAELNDVRRRLTRSEDEAEMSRRRAAAAESTIARLKQELKSFKSQVRQLQAEQGVAGGGDVNMTAQAQRFAQELRNAAGTAELSLRSLLTGVDNLRIMASTLESMHRIEEKAEAGAFFRNDDKDGPAL